MHAPLATGPLLVTQGFGSLRGGPGERFTNWHNNVEYLNLAHNGWDFDAPIGIPVSAVKAGVVVAVALDRFLGNYLVLTMANGEEFTYAHLADFTVASGASVAVDQMIGHTGATGNVTGPHLHFSYRPVHPNFANGFDGHEDLITHFDLSVQARLDFRLV